ncbi:hypothetical protein CDN99_13535 [Roseateles aquatilis]|uniref:Structural protein MipA n=1 Tax=Roseateles aquatilis TaxID=431061 RepID=A0A246JCK6_9BURK|nr:MipA/OmpV family protein [Roseateles aquatilis]OWQ90375.1 hypothetical protein CDN99_13535 [Roseateles aquatilis]
MKLSPAVCALLLLSLGHAAQAQSSAAKSAAASTAPATPQPTSMVVVQAGVGVTTRYAGSDERLVSPMLGVEYAHASGFFAGTMRGIGYAGAAGGLNYSAAIGYRGERKEKSTSGFGINSGSKYLRGMGDVKGSGTLNLSLGYSVTDWLDVQVATEQPFTTRANGALYSFGVAAKVMDVGKDTVVLSVSANAGDKKYMQTYHGVTAAQSAKSGYAVFTPKSGMHQVEAGLSWQHKLSDSWSVTGMVGAQRLLGDAAKSPLTRRVTSPVGAVFVSYSY